MLLHATSHSEPECTRTKTVTIDGIQYMVTSVGHAYQINPETDAVRDAAFFRRKDYDWEDENGDPISMTRRNKFEQTLRALREGQGE